VGASPTRQTLQPEATGAVMEVTKWLKPSISVSQIMLIIITWIAFSIAVGMFASIRRNRSGMGWFFLALILSPLLAIAFAAILREKPTQFAHRNPRGFGKTSQAEPAQRKTEQASGINPRAFFFAYRSPRQISSSTRSSCSR
jgi:phosphate/sulfate permease